MADNKIIIGYWDCRGLVHSAILMLEYLQKSYEFKTPSKDLIGPAPTYDKSKWLEAKSEILEAMHFKQLFAQLPPKTQNQPWTLSYSTQEQGFSLRNLYRSVSTTDDNKLLRQMSHSPGSVTSASACSGSGDPDSESSPCLLIIQVGTS